MKGEVKPDTKNGNIGSTRKWKIFWAFGTGILLSIVCAAVTLAGLDIKIVFTFGTLASIAYYYGIVLLNKADSKTSEKKPLDIPLDIPLDSILLFLGIPFLIITLVLGIKNSAGIWETAGMFLGVVALLFFLGIYFKFSLGVVNGITFYLFDKPPQPSKKAKRKIDDTTVILLYILSFFIPFAGVIVGAIYASKEEEHYKQVGKNCLIFSLINVVLVVLGFIKIAILFS
jgi:hypothetical protein